MSVKLDVNSVSNKEICNEDKNGISETNIFDEIKFLLKESKNLNNDASNNNNNNTNINNNNNIGDIDGKIHEIKRPKKNVVKSLNLDFLINTYASEEFLLPSDSQSLLGEDTILYTVEKDRLQPISSKFMMPGIYKRIAGVDEVLNNATIETTTTKRTQSISQSSQNLKNVYISTLERNGRIIKRKAFNNLYVIAEDSGEPPPPKVLLLDALKSTPTNNKPCKVKQMSTKTVAFKEDALNSLALDILKLCHKDQIVIDRRRNEIIRTQHDSFQKIIYRFMDPKKMQLQQQTTVSGKIANGLCQTNNKEETNHNKFISNKNKSPGRPRKDDLRYRRVKQNTKNKSTINSEKKSIIKSCVTQTTRSGRLVKSTDLKIMNKTKDEIDSIIKTRESFNSALNGIQSMNCCSKKLQQNKYPALTSDEINKYTCDKYNNNDKVYGEELQSYAAKSRKIPPEAICPTCEKIFLGRRLKRHFAQHPDHMKTSTNFNNIKASTIQYTNNDNEDISLFKFLIGKLRKAQQLSEDQKAYLFLNELNDLVEQLQLRCSRLIRNTTGLHTVNQRCSRILGIPEGQYALDISAIYQEAPESIITEDSEPQTLLSLNEHSNSNPSQLILAPIRHLDYTNLSITMDETLTDEAAQKLNLSAGGKLLPPSEESLLRAVDDLVHADMNKINPNAVHSTRSKLPTATTAATTTSTTINKLNISPPSYMDHVSDNAVEAVNMKETSNVAAVTSTTTVKPLLDLSVDFFQFNN